MTKKKTGQSTIAWWLIWIGLTIGSFFVAVWFWTPFIAKRFGSMQEPANVLIWVIAVFGTWLVFLIPLMVLMYWKVDRAYEDARIRREMRAEQITVPYKMKMVTLDAVKKVLPKLLAKQLKEIPPTIRGGHLVTATLKDGRKVENVFIARKKELMGIYDQEELTFDATDIVALEPTDLTTPPDFTQKTWLKIEKSGTVLNSTG